MIIERIVEELNKQGIQYKTLCDYIDVSPSTFSNWINRKTDPPARYIIPICEFLNISVFYLLTGEDKSNSTQDSEDQEWLDMIKKLPKEAQSEFKGELKGYIKRMLEESVAAGSDKKAVGK